MLLTAPLPCRMLIIASITYSSSALCSSSSDGRPLPRITSCPCFLRFTASVSSLPPLTYHDVTVLALSKANGPAIC